MTEKQILEKIAAYPRLGGAGTLAPMRSLLALLGDPQKEVPYIHVAGTNGKGSVCTMTAAILKASGLRVGLYTSPYIDQFRERFRIDGEPIAKQPFCQVAARVLRAADRVGGEHPLSQFDVVTAIGMLLFAEQHCDIVVCECGLGGRLDATNTISAPLCAVITTIGLDHTEILGDTVEKITAEKCGILKDGTGAVICAPQDYPAVIPCVEGYAAEHNIPCTVVREEDIVLYQCTFGWLRFAYRGVLYRSSLAAAYQGKNAATVLELIAALRRLGYRITEEAVTEGLAHAYMPARLELLSLIPHILIDGAHNADGMRALRESVERLSGQYYRLFCLIGMLQDKAPEKALTTFFQSTALRAQLAEVVTITPNSPRACPAEELAGVLQEMLGGGVRVRAGQDILSALRALLADMRDGDLLLCFGSLYVMGDVRRAVQALYTM